MTREPADWPRVAETLEALRRELAELGERVAVLERRAGAGGAGDTAQAPAPPAAPAAAAEGLSEETVLVIAAAVAAFLGKKAPIRQIRLLGSAAWAQQGRVTIQASHALEVHPTRRPS
jgi:methylmalonyl-CoA carboxyltransferase large subunit